MKLKRFEAPSLHAALAEVAAQVGDDALIVETKPTRRGYVVVAGAPAPTVARRTAPRRWTRGFAPLADAATEFGIDSGLLRTVERALIGTRIDVSQPGDPAIGNLACRVLQNLIATQTLSLPDYKVTALIGPTGVGKTTTLAKLAALAKQRGERVALVSVDTYRLGAADQLRAIAEMLDVPFRLLRSPSDMIGALARHASDDRILIDTIGRGPFDTDAIDALRTTLAIGRPTCVLCVPANARRNDVGATIDAYAAFEPRAAILTKWDETAMPGEALSVVVQRGLPISHLTTGQEIPEDIVDADAELLATAALDCPPRVADHPTTEAAQ